MNKLISKIVGVTLGLTLAVGTGVAIAANNTIAPALADDQYVETAFSSVATGDIGVIVGNNGSYYALSNNNGTSSAPSAVAVNVSNGKLSGTPASTLLWEATVSDGSYQFTVYGGSTNLYCTNTNNGVRVGTNANKAFTIDGGYLKHTATSRYVGIYNSSDWRCYTSSTTNIGSQTFAFYKKTASETPTTTVASVSISGAPVSTVTNVNVGTTANLSATATLRTGNETPTFTWASNNENVAKVSSSGVVTYVGNGTANITATASFDAGSETGDTNVGSVSITTQNLIGSVDNPFTVAEAIAVATSVGETATTYDCYTSGIVSRVKTDETYNSNYGNKIFWFSSDGEETSEIEAYRCLYLNNAKMTEAQFNSIEKGDQITIVGKIVNYGGNTPEYTSGCYLTAHTKPVLPRVTITESSQTIFVNRTLTLHATTENQVSGSTIKWESSAPAIASINETSGVVTGNSVGSASITAKMVSSNDEVIATSSSITISVVQSVVNVGDLIYISAEYNSTDYYLSALGGTSSSSSTESDKIVFTVVAGSTNDSFALQNGTSYLKCTTSSPYLGSGDEIDSTTSWIISSDGTNHIITSVSTSTRKIMWNYNDGSPRYGAYTNTTSTIVYPQITKIIVADPTTLTMDTATITLGAGEQSDTLTFTTDSPNATFNWASEDTAKATVANGVVTAIANNGTVKIYVYFDTNGNGQFDLGTDLSAYCTVTLVAPSIDYSTITYGGTGVKVTSSNKSTYIKDGAKIIMTHGDEVVAGPYGKFMLPSDEDVTFSNDTVTIGDGTETLTSFTIFELEASTNGYFLKMKNGKYLSNTSTSAKAGDFTTTDSGSTEWVVSEDGIYDYSNETYATVKFNTSSGAERFKTYASSFANGDAVVVYSFLEYTDEAEAYASNFLSSGLCGSDNNTKADATIWGQQRTAFLALSAGAQTLLANGQANENATNNIQKCLARYDRVIYLHYTAEAASYPDFMNRVANNFVTPLTANTTFGIVDSNTMLSIVIITFALSATTVGGYFFLRKKKEN